MQSLFVAEAQYNRWANQRLYTELARLTPAQLTETSAVNFGSIIAIANHLLLADRLWLFRFTNAGNPVSTADAVPYPALADLAAARNVEDARIIAFANDLDPDWFAATLTYTTTEGTPMAMPVALCVAHFFNHQTHHRGQIHGMLGAFGIKAADIDLLGFERETGSYAASLA